MEVEDKTKVLVDGEVVYIDGIYMKVSVIESKASKRSKESKRITIARLKAPELNDLLKKEMLANA